MCLGFISAEPVRYTRQDPYENFYNGNIYDPKPEEVKKTKVERTPNAESSSNYENTNPINSSGTGLQIYTGGN